LVVSFFSLVPSSRFSFDRVLFGIPGNLTIWRVFHAPLLNLCFSLVYLCSSFEIVLLVSLDSTTLLAPTMAAAN
jgi:hypothetical protein